MIKLLLRITELLMNLADKGNVFEKSGVSRRWEV